MSRRGPTATLCLLALFAAAPGARAAETAPDTAVVLVVNDRVVRVRDFVRDYFSAWPPDRPATDSTGRREFLNTLVNREILAEVARKANRPFGFEDRIQIREITQRALANALYQRTVLDSVSVPQAEIDSAYAQTRWELKLRRIVFPDRATAERVRADLVAKRVTWRDAHARHSVATLRTPEGDMGWFSRRQLDSPLPPRFFGLAPGQISEVYDDVEGPTLVQAFQRRPATGVAIPTLRMRIGEQVRQQKIDALASRNERRIAQSIGLAFDTANVAYAARHFPSLRTPEGKFILNETVPEFAPGDTSRVLARFKDGHYTLDQLLHAYQDVSPIQRRSLNTPAAVQAEVTAQVLEPYRADAARAMGLERDSLVVKWVGDRTEGLRVTHLFEDSIETRVSVEPSERRKYYQEHLPAYFSYARARFAIFRIRRRGEADSVAARLRAGESAEAMLRADSLRGVHRGAVRLSREDESGFPWKKADFERLKPGFVSVTGPDGDAWVVHQLLEFYPGRQLTFEEVQDNVDESVRNLKGEARLKELIARHRRGMRIETRPEVVDRIAMVEP